MGQVVGSFDGGDAAARLAGGNVALGSKLAAAARLEAAAVEQAYGDVKAAEAHLTAAEGALGLSLKLTGAAFQGCESRVSWYSSNNERRQQWSKRTATSKRRRST